MSEVFILAGIWIVSCAVSVGLIELLLGYDGLLRTEEDRGVGFIVAAVCGPLATVGLVVMLAYRGYARLFGRHR